MTDKLRMAHLYTTCIYIYILIVFLPFTPLIFFISVFPSTPSVAVIFVSLLLLKNYKSSPYCFFCFSSCFYLGFPLLALGNQSNNKSGLLFIRSKNIYDSVYLTQIICILPYNSLSLSFSFLFFPL